ncbi:MAG: enoyl-CoA hydratase/isomerase family protein [Phycisphaerales bacterium]|nr:enoyl-CoA hydratase/isomerase family protein [Phycisphaerales bacterium]
MCTDALHVFTLSNPDRRNALTVNVLESIAQAARDADAASVLLIKGEGPVFCSGFDMDLVRADPEELQRLIHALSHAIRAIRRTKATTVVHIQGAAVAGGCALAMACDVVVARAGARLGYPVHALGISPAVTLPVLLPAAGGVARRMVMDGRLHRAEQLLTHGIVHHLLEASDSIDPIIESLLKRGLHASHVTKQWLNELEAAWDDSRFDGPAAAQ